MKAGPGKPVLKGKGVKAADNPSRQAMRSCRKERLTEHTAWVVSM